MKYPNRRTELQPVDLNIVVAGAVDRYGETTGREVVLLQQKSTGREFYLESHEDVHAARARANELQGKLQAGNLQLEQVVMDRHGIKMIKWSET